MQSSIRYLALLGLGLTTLAVARPDQDQRDLQRTDRENDRPAAAPAPAPAQSSAPRGIPHTGFGPSAGAPRGMPPGAPQSPPQASPQGQRQPGGFGAGVPGGNGAGNGGGNWRNGDHNNANAGDRGSRDDSRNDNRNGGGRVDGPRNDARNDGWRGNNQRAEGGRRDYGHDGDRDGRRNSWSTERGRNYYDRRQFDGFRERNYRYNGGRYFARARYRLGAFYWPRGYGARLWLIGEWLPSAFFYDDGYYLYSYGSYGLYAPPFGCRWLRVGDDALLVDEFSGEVLDAVYDLFW